MSAYLLRECTMRYEVQVLSIFGFRRATFKVSRHSDKNGLFIEREHAEEVAADYPGSVINEVEVPPDYNGEQDHA